MSDLTETEHTATTSRRLWLDEVAVADACLQHPFVLGIASGELAREVFVAYVEQDAWFLRAFARAYALGIAKAPDTSTMEELRDLLDGVLEELQLHRGYAERWGADLDPEPSDATLAYTDFLLRVAWSEPLENILAAMTPCMRLYAHLGSRLLGDHTPDSPYAEWVTTYADPGFDALAGRLEALLDRSELTPGVARNYHTAMQREYAFFDQVGRAGDRTDDR